MKNKFQVSLEEGIHRRLNDLAGEWMGNMQTWLEPGKLEEETSIEGNIRTLLEGRFILHEYQTSFKGAPVAGMAIMGYSIDTAAYQCAWIDSFHTGTTIMFSEGGESAKLLSVLGSYSGVDIPEPWGWKTEIEQLTQNRIIITSYNITPKGESAKAIEIVYNRK